MSAEANIPVLDDERKVIGKVIEMHEDETGLMVEALLDAPPPEGSFADGPRPQRRFNARTRRHVLVKPDARKARNKAQRQARKRSRGR